MEYSELPEPRLPYLDNRAQALTRHLIFYYKYNVPSTVVAEFYFFYQCFGSRSGSRRTKMTHKNRKNLEISCLEADGFFCSLDVLYGGLGVGKSQFFFLKKILIFFQLYIFSNCWSLKPGSGSNEYGSETLIFIKRMAFSWVIVCLSDLLIEFHTISNKYTNRAKQGNGCLSTCTVLIKNMNGRAGRLAQMSHVLKGDYHTRS